MIVANILYQQFGTFVRTFAKRACRASSHFNLFLKSSVFTFHKQGNCRKASMNSAKKEGLRNSVVLARPQSAIFSGFTQASELVDEDPSCLHPTHKE
jgi:hypothetical protein